MPQGTKILPHHTMSAFRQNIFPLKLRCDLFRRECVINYALLFLSTLGVPVCHLEGSLLLDRRNVYHIGSKFEPNSEPGVSEKNGSLQPTQLMERLLIGPCFLSSLLSVVTPGDDSL